MAEESVWIRRVAVDKGDKEDMQGVDDDESLQNPVFMTAEAQGGLRYLDDDGLPIRGATVSKTDERVSSTPGLSGVESSATTSDENNKEQTEIDDLAGNLLALNGYTTDKICGHIGGPTERHGKILKSYMQKLDFSGLSIVDALRLMMRNLAFLGEASETARILDGFSQRYAEQSPGSFGPASDAVDNTLRVTTATVMLNGDRYNKNVKDKMTKAQFTRMLEGQQGADDEGENGLDFDKTILSEIFDQVLYNEIRQAGQGNHFAPKKFRGTIPFQMAFCSKRGKRKPDVELIFSLPEPLARVDFEEVVARRVVRKDFHETITLRKWRPKRISLLGSRLLYHSVKRNLDAKLPHTYSRGLRNAFLVRHTLAEVLKPEEIEEGASGFKLGHADGRLWHFRTKSIQSAQQWVDLLNKTAALHSPPPIAAAVASRNAEFLMPMHTVGACRKETLDEKTEWQTALLSKHRKKLRRSSSAQLAALQEQSFSFAPWVSAQEVLQGERIPQEEEELHHASKENNSRDVLKFIENQYIKFEVRRFQVYLDILSESSTDHDDDEQDDDHDHDHNPDQNHIHYPSSQ
eukprot:m.134222 g.134222  ORF g.134222 m.134222 type:complete len:576 (+) comp29725_c1_seq8:48-1775(+)